MVQRGEGGMFRAMAAPASPACNVPGTSNVPGTIMTWSGDIRRRASRAASVYPLSGVTRLRLLEIQAMQLPQGKTSMFGAEPEPKDWQRRSISISELIFHSTRPQCRCASAGLGTCMSKYYPDANGQFRQTTIWTEPLASPRKVIWCLFNGYRTCCPTPRMLGHRGPRKGFHLGLMSHTSPLPPSQRIDLRAGSACRLGVELRYFSSAVGRVPKAKAESRVLRGVNGECAEKHGHHFGLPLSSRGGKTFWETWKQEGGVP